MTDYMSRLVPAELPMADVIPAIGATALRWTQVEVSTQRMMSALLRVEGRIAVGLTAHIADRTAVDIILSVARQYELPEGTLAAIESFATAHNLARGNRNLVVHGIHGHSEEGIEPSRSFVQRVAARGNVKVTFYEISLDEIYEIAVECSALAHYGHLLCEHISSSGGDNPHKLPELFPRLRDRMCTLHQLDVHDVLRRRSYASGWTGLNREERGPQ